MSIFWIIFPVFFIFTIGFVGQKLIGFNIKSVSTTALYLMSPFLAFRTFYTQPLHIDYLYIFLFAICLSFLLFILVWVIAKMMNATRSERSAMILGAVFMNSGNYGVPVVLFAFGTVGFDYAVVMMVIQSLLMNSVGIFFASIGGEYPATWRDALQKVMRMPLIYAAALGILLQLLSLRLPTPFIQGIDLIADASIPTVMLVLGMQLAAIVRKKVTYRYVTVVTIIRMVLSPILAFGILFFLPVHDLLKSVLIIQAAMPAAANTTMFALQFGTEPDLVSFTTFLTTIISLFTLPIVLILLNVPA